MVCALLTVTEVHSSPTLPLLFESPELSPSAQAQAANYFQTRLARLLLAPDEQDFLPDRFQINLFNDASFDVEVISRSTNDQGIYIWRGQTQATEVQREDFVNVLILINPVTGFLTGTLSQEGRLFTFEAIKGQEDYLLREHLKLEDELIIIASPEEPEQPLSRQKREIHEDEGVYVLDFLIGFSEKKAQQLADMDLTASAMIEHVNVALNNSLVDQCPSALVPRPEPHDR